jgi:hypothetical protein
MKQASGGAAGRKVARAEVNWLTTAIFFAAGEPRVLKVDFFIGFCFDSACFVFVFQHEHRHELSAQKYTPIKKYCKSFI